MGNFCPDCGTPLRDSPMFCPKCGKINSRSERKETYNYHYNFNNENTSYNSSHTYNPPFEDVVKNLSKKIEIEGIIWTVVACLQYIIGLSTLIFIVGIPVIVVAILNTITAVNNFDYSKKILYEPVGICEKYDSIGGRVATLIYNILFGGIIGVAGSIYDFIVRDYVMTRKNSFIKIQNEFIEKQRKGGL